MTNTFRLSVTQNGRTVAVEEHYRLGMTVTELLLEFKLLALALGYHEETWRDAICDFALVYENNSEKNETPEAK